MSQTEKPKVFISYSSRDSELKDRLLKHLSVGDLRDSLEVWHDRDIEPGSDWQAEIAEALSKTAVAVVLVSPDLLASKFATEVEIPALLRQRESGNAVVLPVIAQNCLWHEVDWIRPLQVMPKAGVALSDLSSDEREAALSRISEQILGAWESLAARSTEPPTETALEEPRTDEGPRPEIFISHCHEDGDFAEVMQARIEKRGYTAWIDLERLSPGEDWRQGIDDGICNCAVLIVVVSPQARESEYVTYEWAYAWGKGVKAVPIMIKPTTIHPRLETLQYLDFTNRAARPWGRLMEVLDATCGNKNAA